MGLDHACIVAQVRLLFEMLNLDPWCYYPLTVQMLSSSYTNLRAKCIAPPAHVAVTTAPMEVQNDSSMTMSSHNWMTQLACPHSGTPKIGIFRTPLMASPQTTLGSTL